MPPCRPWAILRIQKGGKAGYRLLRTYSNGPVLVKSSHFRIRKRYKIIPMHHIEVRFDSHGSYISVK